MRICIFGAGAIGGMIGSLLKYYNIDVTLIARGENYNEIKKCPKCNKTTASGFEQIDELFGHREVGGKIRPQSWCRSCR